MRCNRLGVALAIGLSVTTQADPARAWDPAVTNAGLTERALLASSFHKVLAQRLGRPLGALEPLALQSKLLPGELRQGLWARLTALDPAAGYRPDVDGVNTAMAWVTAGAVLAETPPERGRNHFFEPETKRGLDDAGGLSGTLHALRLSIDGSGSPRGLATGTAFDLTGLPTLRWLTAPENELGLPVFEDHLEKAIAAREPVEREAALVRSLLALGGVLAALEDSGEPAHVRNDFRATFLRRQGPSGWDRASSFERYVAEQYGRAGVPAPTSKITRPNLESFFSAADGAGLADRTHRRFFSDGTVPADVAVTANMSPEDVRQAAEASLPWQQPTVGRLELRGPAQVRYVTRDKRRVLAYQREPEGVRFFLDEAIYADSATALLPEVAAYAAGLVDHLFRASAIVNIEGGNVSVKLQGLRGDAGEGRLTMYAEDASGRRTAFGDATPRAFNGETSVSGTFPAGTRRVAVCFRGKDAAGALLAFGESLVK
ncbi:MAG TPA: hypothetical protein VGG33_07460 [Polyangia bacterium]